MEFVNESRVELIKHNASDLDVARAAWVSNYGEDAREKDGKRVKGLINFLYREKHMSPFEHGSFTFFVETPIFVAREFMRHRTASYNEVSGRYKELSPKFYVPAHSRPKVQEGAVGNYYFTEGNYEQNVITEGYTRYAYEQAWDMYQAMLEKGIAKEVARNVLPVGIMTSFYVTMNPRNLMQFLTLRNAPNALFEIREVAKKMEDIFAEAMPFTYEAYSWDSYKENIKASEARAASEYEAVKARAEAKLAEMTANPVAINISVPNSEDINRQVRDIVERLNATRRQQFKRGGIVNGE